MEKIHSNSNNNEHIASPYESNLQASLIIAAELNTLLLKESDFLLENGGKGMSDFYEEKNKLEISITKMLLERIEILQQQGIESIEDSEIIKEISTFEKRRIYSEESGEKEIKNAFYGVATEMVRKHGYKLSPTSHFSQDLLVFEKGNSLISLRITDRLLKNSFSLGGSTRICSFNVSKEEDIGRTVCAFENSEWTRACDNKETQKDIDKILAILG